MQWFARRLALAAAIAAFAGLGVGTLHAYAAAECAAAAACLDDIGPVDTDRPLPDWITEQHAG